MSPNEPLPIFRPSRYLFPTLSSMVAGRHCLPEKQTWSMTTHTNPYLHGLKMWSALLFCEAEWRRLRREPSQLLVCYVSHRRAELATCLCACVRMLPKRDELIGNSCLASTDTRLGQGGRGVVAKLWATKSGREEWNAHKHKPRLF